MGLGALEIIKEDPPLPFFEIGPGEVRRNDKVGRYVVATRDIKEGEIICEEYPLLISPRFDFALLWTNCIGVDLSHKENNNNHLLNVCLTCFKKCSAVCTNCSWPVCDFKCEKAYLHSQYECKVFRENRVAPSDFEFDFNAVETLRCLLLRDREPKAWDKLQTLEPLTAPRAKDWKTKQCRDYVIDFIQRKCGFAEESYDDLDTILGITSINSFSLAMNYSRHISAIFHNSALFAHHCDPNLGVIWGFHPTETCSYDQKYFSIKFYANRDIAKGESMTHTYFQRPKPLLERQELLANHYYFKCDCEECRIELFNEIFNNDEIICGKEIIEG